MRLSLLAGIRANIFLGMNVFSDLALALVSDVSAASAAAVALDAVVVDLFKNHPVLKFVCYVPLQRFCRGFILFT